MDDDGANSDEVVVVATWRRSRYTVFAGHTFAQKKCLTVGPLEGKF
jgi:hypothetical protein